MTQSADKKYFAQIKGINTEAPLVSWPEGFTIDEQNFDLLIDGSRRRRPGLSAEPEEIIVTPSDDIVLSGTPHYDEGMAIDGFTLEWTSYTFNDGNILQGYRLYRSDNGGAYSLLTTTDDVTETYDDMTIVQGHLYEYYVVGYSDGDTVSANSNIVEYEFAFIESQCFNLYTAASDLIKAQADGLAIDDELQFETEAGKTYWMYGRIRFVQDSAAQFPGAKFKFAHLGDTVILSSPMVASLSYYPAGSDPYTGKMIPMDATLLDSGAYVSKSDVGTTDIWEIAIECMLVVGATGGTFGLEWGILNAGLGSTNRLAGSYFTAIEVIE